MTETAHTDEIREAYVRYRATLPGDRLTRAEAEAAFDRWHERQKRRRPKRGVVATVDDLHALPTDSIIGIARHGWYRVYERGSRDWLTTSGGVFDEDWLPADIIWTPGDTDE